MFKRVISRRSSAPGTSASGSASSRSSTRSTRSTSGCTTCPRRSCAAQTEKFRAIIHERTDELEARVAALKEQKRDASGSAERERIDHELSGAGRPRRRSKASCARRSPTCSTRSCPKRSRRCARPRAACVGTSVHGHGARADLGHGALRRAAHRRHRSCTWARSPRWRPAKARRWSRRCRST